jgi:hypothetical protein
LAFQHTSRPFPASHIRGTSHIDFILVTPGISSSVQSSGGMSFHSFFHSDHRAYHVDFTSTSLIADPAYKISPHPYQKLQLQDPTLVNDYRTALYDQLKEHNIFQWLEKLQNTITAGAWQPQDMDAYNALDRTITEAMLSAEKNIGKGYSTRFEWSPTPKRAVEVHRYWHLRFRQARCPTLSVEVLHAHHRRLELPPKEIELTSQDIITRLNNPLEH